MKTNNTKTYVLVAAVLAVWGVIGYKIIKGINSDDINLVEDTFTNFKPQTIEATKIFTIDTLNRDPFLGTLRTKVSKNKPKKRSNLSKPKALMPKVNYTGLIKKQNTKDQVFVVSINNNQYLLKKGQTVDSIKLIRGNSKEIVIRYQSKTKLIKRN